MRPKPIIPQFHQMVLTVALHKKSPAGFWTSPIRIRRSPMSNSHMQSAKAIVEDIAHLCCVPDDWRLQISDLAAWPFLTFCAKPTTPVHCQSILEPSWDGSRRLEWSLREELAHGSE